MKNDKEQKVSSETFFMAEVWRTSGFLKILHFLEIVQGGFQKFQMND